MAVGGGWQSRIVVDDPGVAALPFDDAAEHLDAGTGRDRLAHARFGADVIRDPGEDDHARGQAHGQLLERLGPAALERLERFDDLESVAHCAAERRVHRGDERLGPHSGPGADGDQRFGQRPRIVERLHERARTGLDVEHERADALGDLLAHDRRGDERNALDGARHVAQGVELLVRRGDFRRLPDQAAAHFREHPLKLAEQQ